MGLSEQESRTLAALLRKKDQPDPPAGRTDRVLNVSIDLADEKQVERARGLGLIDWLTGGDDDPPADDPPADDPPADEPPRRRGFFAE